MLKCPEVPCGLWCTNMNTAAVGIFRSTKMYAGRDLTTPKPIVPASMHARKISLSLLDVDLNNAVAAVALRLLLLV